MVTRTELPAASLPERLKWLCCLSAKTQPARSTSCGAALSSVTVSISGSSIELASAATMRTEAGEEGGGTISGGTTGGGTTGGGTTGWTGGVATVVAWPFESVIHDWLWKARKTAAHCWRAG